jgi:hydroxymethylglutaryl-CoA lyase
LIRRDGSATEPRGRPDEDRLPLPTRVRVVEVGPRDGFQNLDRFVPTADKIAVVDRLLPLGFDRVEVTSFVHPQAVPQMRDAERVMAAVRRDGAPVMVLVPNRRGAERALATRPDMLDFVLSASESHNRANLNHSVADSLGDLEETLELAHAAEVPLRLTVATAFGCPYEGEVDPGRVIGLAERGAELGVAEVALGDTTGMADPAQVYALFRRLARELPDLPVAVHLHHTRGAGAANLLAALQAGVTVFDASVGGMGGCPYAPGATGNVSTEDMVHMLERMGVDTGVDLPALIEVAREVERRLGIELPGQVMRAGRTVDLAQSPAR